LNDVQRAADNRDRDVIVRLMSRANAVPLLGGNRAHMVHDWMPRGLLERAAEARNGSRENLDDGNLTEAAVDQTLARSWRIQVRMCTPDNELELLAVPNPRILPPHPTRPAP